MTGPKNSIKDSRRFTHNTRTTQVKWSTLSYHKLEFRFPLEVKQLGDTCALEDRVASRSQYIKQEKYTPSQSLIYRFYVASHNP